MGMLNLLKFIVIVSLGFNKLHTIADHCQM